MDTLSIEPRTALPLLQSMPERRLPQEAEPISLGAIAAAIRVRAATLAASQKSFQLENVENDHKIALVSDETINLADNVKLDEPLEEIFLKYADKFALVEEERQSLIRELDGRIKSSQALQMARGITSAVSSDVESKKRKALQSIEQQATRKNSILLIEAKKELLDHQKTVFKNIFEQYSSKCDSFPNFAEKLAASKASVDEAFIKEEATLKKAGDVTQKTDQDIKDLLTTLIEHDRDRFAALKPLVRLSINGELNKIEKAFASLEILSNQSKQNQFINPQSLTLLRDQFVSAKENFFVAEAIDCSQARNVALKNAADLQVAIKKLQQEIEGASQAAVRAGAADKLKLNEKVASLKNLAAGLTIAQQAWKQIAADSNLRIKTKSDDTNFFNLNILSKLDVISSEKDQHWMIARRGEVEIIRPVTLIKKRKPYREANDFIRLAVFRDFGSEALERFDHEFRNDLIAENPLTVAQLKKFAQEESQKNSPVFYLSPAHPFRELIFSSPQPDDEVRIVQVESSGFKLFDGSSSEGSAVAKEKKEGESFDALRAALAEFFQNLPEENQLFILKRFDDQFVKEGKEKQLLTVQNLKKFFNAELKRERVSLTEHDMVGPVLSSIASNLGTLLLENITSLPGVSSLGPMALLVAGVAMGVSGDMNTMWQELRGRHPRRR